jgi:hypothetical protein
MPFADNPKNSPADVPRRRTSVTTRHTLYLEDLDVRPGDFVSYYVRARDVTRGTRPNEGRSDIFFLEVRPFEQEFALAQSQSMAGSGYNGSIDELVTSQKQIVVATWKLDRRGQNVKGGQSPADIHAIGRSEADLKARVEETASSLRESTMRDPRRRLQGRRRIVRRSRWAGQCRKRTRWRKPSRRWIEPSCRWTRSDRRARSHRRCRRSTRCSEAQALVKSDRCRGSSRLRAAPEQPQLRYLRPCSTRNCSSCGASTRRADTRWSEQRERGSAPKIAELARRQGRCSGASRISPGLDDAEMARQLEKLTREQAELRQAEELARRMSKLESGGRTAGPPSASASASEQTARQLRDISDDMRKRDQRSAPPRFHSERAAAGRGPLKSSRPLNTSRRRQERAAQRFRFGSKRDAEPSATSEQRGRARSCVRTSSV